MSSSTQQTSTKRRRRLEDQWPVLISLQNPSFILEKPLSLKYEDRPVPKLQTDRDVIVDVKWTGICGSDVSSQKIISLFFSIRS